MDVNDNKNGVGVILLENLVDLDVVGLEAGSGGIPPDDVFIDVNLGR